MFWLIAVSCQLSAVCALLWAAPAVSAYTPPAGSPLERHEHPRLALTAANLSAIRTKVGGEFRTEYQQFITDLDGRIGGAYDTYEMSNYAFVCALGPISGITYGNSMTAYCDKAKSLVNSAPSPLIYTADGFHMAMAYDWIYSQLSASERAAAVAKFKTANDGYAGSKGDPFESHTIRYHAGYLLSGIAVWGDGIDDAWANTVLDNRSLYLDGPGGIYGAPGAVFPGEGAYAQGWSYSINEGNPPYWFTPLESWRTANGLTKAAVYGASWANFPRSYAEWLFYHIPSFGTPCASCPGGYDYILYRDQASAPGVHAHKREFQAILSALRTYKGFDDNVAGLAQWMLNEKVGQFTSIYPSTSMKEAGPFNFILGDKSVTPKSPAQLGLPLTKIFPNYGWAVMHSGWTPSDTTVTFTAARWGTNSWVYSNAYHGGTFTITRKGPLVINSGSSIHQDYIARSFAYNTLLFVDPAETPPMGNEFWDKGGQRTRFADFSSASVLTPGSGYDVGGIKKILPADPGAGRNVDYIYADVTRAYNGPAFNDGYNTNKVKLFTRQFVYFRPETAGGPDQIVVFDRTESVDTKFEKRWHLHTSRNPTVDGTGTPGPSRGADGAAGKTTYTGASLVTDTPSGYSGKIFSKTLLPTSVKIVKVGGSGREFEDSYGVLDTGAGGQPYNPAIGEYMGSYRVEVIPTAPALKDNFLHVIEANDASAPSMTPSALLTGANMQGARFGNKIAMFNQNEAVLTSGNFTIDAAGNYKVLIADLNAGQTYSVQSGATTVSRAASSAGTVYVDINAGSSNVLVTVTAGGAPPAPAGSACDLNQDGATNIVDVQGMVNQAIGAAACTADLNRDGACNVIDVQRVVNAALGGPCVSP